MELTPPRPWQLGRNWGRLNRLNSSEFKNSTSGVYPRFENLSFCDVTRVGMISNYPRFCVFKNATFFSPKKRSKIRTLSWAHVPNYRFSWKSRQLHFWNYPWKVWSKMNLIWIWRWFLYWRLQFKFCVTLRDQIRVFRTVPNLNFSYFHYTSRWLRLNKG